MVFSFAGGYLSSFIWGSDTATTTAVPSPLTTTSPSDTVSTTPSEGWVSWLGRKAYKTVWTGWAVTQFFLRPVVPGYTRRIDNYLLQMGEVF